MLYTHQSWSMRVFPREIPVCLVVNLRIDRPSTVCLRTILILKKVHLLVRSRARVDYLVNASVSMHGNVNVFV